MFRYLFRSSSGSSQFPR